MNTRFFRVAVWAGLYVAGLAAIGLFFGICQGVVSLFELKLIGSGYMSVIFLADLIRNWTATFLVCLSFRSRTRCGICMGIAGFCLLLGSLTEIPHFLTLSWLGLLKIGLSLLTHQLPYLAALISGVLFLTVKNRALAFWIAGGLLFVSCAVTTNHIVSALLVVAAWLLVHFKAAWFFPAASMPES